MKRSTWLIASALFVLILVYRTRLRPWLFWLAAIPLASFVFIVPSMLELNAVIYAYVWSATQSLAVSSVYHAAYDEIRDAIEKSIGFGLLVSLWEMAMTTVIGAILLWRGNWQPLRQERNDAELSH